MLAGYTAWCQPRTWPPLPPSSSREEHPPSLFSDLRPEGTVHAALIDQVQQPKTQLAARRTQNQHAGIKEFWKALGAFPYSSTMLELMPIWQWPVSTLIQYLVVATVVGFFLSSLRGYYRLRHIDGPFLAKFSRLWLLQTVGSGKAYLYFWNVTEKYGSPPCYSFWCIAICYVG